MIKISVITVNYNNAVQLEQTILSVISQTYAMIEYIVIDGGSSDGSNDVIKKYQDSISYWISEPDKGIYNAMNKGIAIASGDYCLFLNSGDTLYNKETLADCSIQLKSDFVCGKALLQYNKGTKLWQPPRILDSLFFERRFSLCHQSLFIKTSLIKSRNYNEEYRIVADYEQQFYEIVVNKATYQCIDTIVCNYRMDGVSANHAKADVEKKKIVRLYRAFGYIETNELIALTEDLKIGSKKYKLVLYFAKLLLSGINLKK